MGKQIIRLRAVHDTASVLHSERGVLLPSFGNALGRYLGL
jgi:hypothetical protein